jgi:hypothetical protein
LIDKKKEGKRLLERQLRIQKMRADADDCILMQWLEML